jgi:3-oxoacyl-(acyl-carrier-protein) synthase
VAAALDTRGSVAISDSLAFGGNNAVLVIGSAEQ